MQLALGRRALQGVVAAAVSAVLSGATGNPAQRDENCAAATPASTVTYTSPFGQQRPVAADSAEWRIHLSKWRPSKWPPQQFTFELKNDKTSAVSDLTFDAWGPASKALQVNQVDEIHIFSDKLLILGRAGANSSEAVIVQLPSGKILDRFACFMPAVSPTSRFMAFLKSFPGHPGPVSVTAEYLVYSLSRSGSNSPNLRAIYPPGATTTAGSNLVPGLESLVHWISSDRIFWLDAKTLAFADQYHGEVRLVLADLNDEVQSPSVRTETLDPSGLLDLANCRHRYSAADLKNLSRDSSALLRVKELVLTSQKPGFICVRFDSNPCLTRTELTLKAP
jgi:hypothetical protein